jgi:hypothetical protein
MGAKNKRSRTRRGSDFLIEAKVPTAKATPGRVHNAPPGIEDVPQVVCFLSHRNTMNTQRGARSAFFLTKSLLEWGNLEEYIIHSRTSNRDHRSYLPEKFVQVYKAALEEIIQDETRTAEERSMAETLKATNVSLTMFKCLTLKYQYTGRDHSIHNMFLLCS